MPIGKKIQELRKIRDLTLTELAQRSGVQLATLSRMENNKMTGTVESHRQIAEALGVDLPTLYKDTIREDSPLTPSAPKSLTDTFSHSDQAYFEILTSNILSKRMLPILLRVEAKGKTNLEQNAPGSEKFVFVLEGEAEVVLESKSYRLKKHHTLYFDASKEHYFQNYGKTACKLLVVATPVQL